MHPLTVIADFVQPTLKKMAHTLDETRNAAQDVIASEASSRWRSLTTRLLGQICAYPGYAAVIGCTVAVICLLVVFVFVAISDILTASLTLLVFIPLVVFSARTIARAIGILKEEDEYLPWLQERSIETPYTSPTKTDDRPDPDPDHEWLHDTAYIPKYNKLSRAYPKPKYKIQRRA